MWQEASCETEHYISVTEGARNTVVAIRMSTLSKGAEVKQRHYEEHHADITQQISNSRQRLKQIKTAFKKELSVVWSGGMSASSRSVIHLHPVGYPQIKTLNYIKL
jgi:hypothetical protein